jgi:hypothetical protein
MSLIGHVERVYVTEKKKKEHERSRRAFQRYQEKEKRAQAVTKNNQPLLKDKTSAFLPLEFTILTITSIQNSRKNSLTQS